MRRISLLLALLLLLSGCASPLVPAEYTMVREHSETVKEERSDALTAESYDELKYDVLAFVEGGVEHGVIHVYNYDGDVAKDVSAASYAVWKNDPLGAYAVEFITTECNLLLSYYEIRVEITYRRSPAEIADIQYVRGTDGAQTALETALSGLYDRLTLRISAYDETADWKALAASYFESHKDTMMELPKVTAEVYPDEGSTRILELNFEYDHTAEELAAMQNAVNSVLNSAANYVRYRKEDDAKAELLFTYLMERFDYEEGESDTPAYSLLCEGIADSAIFSQIFQVLCDKSELSCQTVSGYLDGEAYTWNILKIDGKYSHVDLMRCVREGLHQLTYYTDDDMARYSWDRSAYPVCDSAQAETETAETEAGGTVTTAPPETSPAESAPVETESEPAG